MNSISIATFSAARATTTEHHREDLVALDGAFAAPDAVDGFDAPENRGAGHFFATTGEPGELTKPEATAPSPDKPLEFAVIPVLVAAGEAVVTLAAGVVASLIANEITKKVHETRQTKPEPTPPQAPPSGPANPQAGIIITPLPPPT